MESGSEEQLGQRYRELLEQVRAGARLGDEHLGPSDLILPPPDLTLDEAAEELTGAGLIPTETSGDRVGSRAQMTRSPETTQISPRWGGGRRWHVRLNAALQRRGERRQSPAGGVPRRGRVAIAKAGSIDTIALPETPIEATRGIARKIHQFTQSVALLHRSFTCPIDT